MNRTMLYGMLVLFLLFMITANPARTGEDGRSFIDWLSSGWDDTREFVDSLVGDAESDRNELGEVPIPTLGPEEPSVDQGTDPAPQQPASG